MNAIRRSIVSLLLPLSVLILSTGCMDKPLDVKPADEALLRNMAQVKADKTGHAMLVSRSSLIAVLPVNYLTEEPPALPVRGLFLGDYRLLDGWSWEANETRPTDPGALAMQRPDRVERPWTGVGMERVTLDPEAACGVIELTQGPGRQVRFLPRFDLRLIQEPSAPATIEWIEENEVLLAGLQGDDIYIAFVSNGGYAPSPLEERIDYAAGWGPLEEVASVQEPGFFSFAKASGAAVAFGVAERKQDAIKLAQNALEQKDELTERALNRVEMAMDQTRVRSKDAKFEGIAAWDLWWATEGLLVEGQDGQTHRLARPPLPYYGDPVVDANTLPTTSILDPHDLTAAENLYASLDADLADRDLEGYIYALSRILVNRTYRSWLTSDETLLEDAQIVATYLPKSSAWSDTFYFDFPSRWDIDLHDAGLPPMTTGTHSHFLGMFLQTLDDIRTGLNRSSPLVDDNAELLNRIYDQQRHEYEFTPADIVVRPPKNWTPGLVEAFREASEDPRFTLAWYERASLPLSYIDQYPRASLALRSWAGENGLHFHASSPYQTVTFNASRWLAWRQVLGETDDLVGIIESAWMAPDYWTWERQDHGLTIQGGAVIDPEVAARRLQVTLEDLIGLQWKMVPTKPRNEDSASTGPRITGFSLKPTGPLEFWKNRAVSFAIGQEPSRILVEMDIYQGVYRFSLPKGSRDMMVDLIDAPVEGERLVGSFTLQPGRVMELKRTASTTGQNTLYVNGVNLRNVSRQKVR